MVLLASLSRSLSVVVCCLTSSSLATLTSRQSGVPTVKVINGTLTGVHNAQYQQDFFLGIPYSQPPVGQLRFQRPASLNTTWNGTRNATKYSPQCIGYGSDTWVLGNYISEDCLTLNVVRPSGSATNLPVGVWIHGGGLSNGGSSDPRYNLSFIVQESTFSRSPFIAVSLNYRLHGWGLLFGKEVVDAGVGNLAFRDQRLALQWVQENIAAFGGDPSKVVIFGESAGARSIAILLNAFGGRDDNLFRGAIMQSGGVSGPEQTPEKAQTSYNMITAATNCSNATDSLNCLRQVPVQILSDVFNASRSTGFVAAAGIDGDFLQKQGFDQLRDGEFVQVPLLHGRNRDEGTGFAPTGAAAVNTTADFLKTVSTNSTIANILAALYPDIPSEGCPETLVGRPPPPSRSFLGLQWKRIAQFINDSRMQAPRRATSQFYAQHNVTQYVYDFNVLPVGVAATTGVTHFTEVAFMFANTMGVGYDTVVATNPFKYGAGAPEANYKIARLMSRMWISFITDLDPNNSGVARVDWPKYTADNQALYVFDANVTDLAFTRKDDFRVAEIEYVMRNVIGA